MESSGTGASQIVSEVSDDDYDDVRERKRGGDGGWGAAMRCENVSVIVTS